MDSPSLCSFSRTSYLSVAYLVPPCVRLVRLGLRLRCGLSPFALFPLPMAGLSLRHRLPILALPACCACSFPCISTFFRIGSVLFARLSRGPRVAAFARSSNCRLGSHIAIRPLVRSAPSGCSVLSVCHPPLPLAHASLPATHLFTAGFPHFPLLRPSALSLQPPSCAFSLAISMSFFLPSWLFSPAFGLATSSLLGLLLRGFGWLSSLCPSLSPRAVRTHFSFCWGPASFAFLSFLRGHSPCLPSLRASGPPHVRHCALARLLGTWSLFCLFLANSVHAVAPVPWLRAHQ